MKSKFKKGDLVTEIEPNYFTKGSVLKVISIESSFSSQIGCKLVSGKERHIPSGYIHYHCTGEIYIVPEDLTKYEQKTMTVANIFPWAKGDKAYVGEDVMDAGNKIRISEVIGDYIYYYDQTQEKRSSFGKTSYFTETLKPRGKKTKAKYAQWEKSQYEIGNWVEFVAEDGADCSCHKTGDKFQIAKMSPSGQCIRSEKRDSWTDAGNVKPCEAPDPWEGIEWTKCSGSPHYRSVKYMNEQYQDRWNDGNWKPVKLEDLTKEELIDLINWNKHKMDKI